MSQAINDMVSAITGAVRANTEQETQWLNSAPKEMQGQMRAQIEMQKVQELVQMLAQAMKQLSEQSKNIIRNIGG
jgi:hypothetical protein